MKNILLLLAIFTLPLGFASCSKNSPEEQAKKIISQTIEAMKSMNFDELQEIQEEEKAYLEKCSEKEKAAYREASMKLAEEYMGVLIKDTDLTPDDDTDSADDLDESDEKES